MKISKILASVAAASLVCGAVAATASAYNAGLAFQNSIYSFRELRANANYGESSPYWAEDVIVWQQGDALDQTYPDFAEYFDWDIEAYTIPGGFNDATVDGDGTYTVSIDEFPWEIDGVNGFNFVKITTDIPYDAFDPNGDPTAFVTSATIYVDGVAQATLENPIPEKDGDFLSVNIINTYNPDMAAYTGAYPTESIAVEFTIDGLGGGDDVSDDAATGGDAAGDTGAATDDNKGSADTGVEGVAAVAGLAVVAGGAVLLSKKRK